MLVGRVGAKRVGRRGQFSPGHRLVGGGKRLIEKNNTNIPDAVQII